ncbi:MAG: DUF86 domain-containing protein, partial [Chloroflexi bacterium]|nr:DUF86 domain-containing protein [Chloroflexota bacterium]
MSRREDWLYLQHILDAIIRIERYLADTTEQHFYVNELLQDGVIRQLEIIGEAARRI